MAPRNAPDTERLKVIYLRRAWVMKPSGKTAARRPTRADLRARRAAQVARWHSLLDEGVYSTRAALARAEGVSRAAVTQGLGPVREEGR